MDFCLFAIIIVIIFSTPVLVILFKTIQNKRKDHNIILLEKELTDLYTKIYIQFEMKNYEEAKNLISQYENILSTLSSANQYSAFYFEKQLIDLIDWYCYYDYEMFK